MGLRRNVPGEDQGEHTATHQTGPIIEGSPKEPRSMVRQAHHERRKRNWGKGGGGQWRIGQAGR